MLEMTDRRARLLRVRKMSHELKLREERKRQSAQGGLMHFVRYFWDVLEPSTPLVEGWALEAICAHLEAVTWGEITRLLINVPPGFMKSLLTDVFWPAWEQSAAGKPHLRYVAFSYAAGLTERDNGKFRDLLLSPKFKELWGKSFKLRKIGEVKVTNDKTGSKLATSVQGIGTGERGNRVIIDDPHNIKESESEAVRGETVRWFKESIQNRLNDIETDAIIVIMQRVHEADVSGAILAMEGAGYIHLMIPMEFDPGRRCETNIWEDPRTEAGELAWPERFSEGVVGGLKSDLGPYAYAGQYQQAPSPRGGGIIKRDWWQLWDDPSDKFPAFDYVLASADTAYTEKEENDPTGFTIWGVWRDKTGAPKIMLVHAWRRFLELHGPYVEKYPDETEAAYIKRALPSWGLVEWLAHSCRRYKVDLLLIEGKASGITVSQELRRLHGTEGWGIQLINPVGDKVARAHAVQPIFSQELVYAPDREWADMVIEEMGSFPKGRYDDLCFVAGTKISTRRGPVSIEKVRVDDHVITPSGWRKVLASGFTGFQEVVASQGLVGTPNHPVFTFEDGYTRLDQIADKTVSRFSLCDLIKTIRQRQSNLKASSIGAWAESAAITSASPKAMTGDVGPRAFMWLFGNRTISRLSCRVSRFITKTVTPLTASLTIWSAYRAACIGAFLNRTLTGKPFEHNWTQRVSSLLLGIVPQRAWSGIANTPSIQFESPVLYDRLPRSSRTAIANGAERVSQQRARSEFSAQPSVSFKSQGCGEENSNSSTRTMQAVFNLTVEGDPCYYANGVLVHNCDSATQALKFLREGGFIQHRFERRAEEEEAARHRGAKPAPLYGA